MDLKEPLGRGGIPLMNPRDPHCGEHEGKPRRGGEEGRGAFSLRQTLLTGTAAMSQVVFFDCIFSLLV